MSHRFLPVVEEGVGRPDLAGQEVVQGQHLHGPVKLEPLVPPALTEEDVDGVLLRESKRLVSELCAGDSSFSLISSPC